MYTSVLISRSLFILLPLILVRRNIIKLNIIQETSFVFHRFDRKTRGCLWDRLHPSPYFYIAFALVVAIPATITLLSYYAIYKHVIESRKKVAYIFRSYLSFSRYTFLSDYLTDLKLHNTK